MHCTMLRNTISKSSKKMSVTHECAYVHAYLFIELCLNDCGLANLMNKTLKMCCFYNPIPST